MNKTEKLDCDNSARRENGGSPAYHLSTLIRGRKKILAGTFVCGLAGIITALMLPNIYRSSATLLVAPPKFSTQLSPGTLSVYTYKELLLNKSVAAALLDNMRQRHPREFARVTAEEMLDKMLRVNIPAGGAKNDTAVSPLLVLSADNRNRQAAKDTVDAWVNIFLARAKKLTALQTDETEQFISTQFDVTLGKLRETEEKLRKFDEAHNLKQMRDEINAKTAGLQNMIADRAANHIALAQARNDREHMAASLAVIRAFERPADDPSGAAPPPDDEFTESQKNFFEDLRLKQTLLNASTQRKIEFDTANDLSRLIQLNSQYKSNVVYYAKLLDNMDFALFSAETQLAEINTELEKQPEIRRLKTGPSSDLILDFLAATPAKEKAESFFNKYSTESETVNPLYLDLQGRRVNTMIEKNMLQAKISIYEKELERNDALTRKDNEKLLILRQKSAKMDIEYSNAVHAAETMLQLRADINRQSSDLLLKTWELENKKDFLTRTIIGLEQETAALNAMFYNLTDTRKDLEREMERMTAAYNLFKTRVEEARIAKAEETSEIKIAAEAVVPDKKIKPKRAILAMLAGLAGLLTSCLAVLFMDFLDSHKNEI